MIEQEQFYALSRMELCEAKVGQERHKSQLTKKERDPHCQGLWLKERQRLNPEDSTSYLRTLKLTDTLEVAQDAQRLHRMEKRQSHMTTNAEREPELSLREP